MSEHTPDPLIEQLVDGLVDGHAAADAWDELARRLRDDEEFARNYIAAMQLESLLRASFVDAAELTATELRLAQGAPPEKAVDVQPRWFASAWSRAVDYRHHPKPLSLAIAAVVVGVLITGMALIFPPAFTRFSARPPAPVVVAQLTSVRDAVWAPGQIGAFVGAHLVAGHQLQLEAGVIKIAHRDGAVVILEGPCNFVVEDLGRGTLHHGRLLARIPPSAVGFRVETPATTIVDLGTEFGVAVSTTGTSNVVVIEGVVECRPPTANHSQRTLSLTKGESAVFQPNGTAATQSRIATRQSLLKWHRLRMESSSALIAQWKFDGDERDAVGACDGTPRGNVRYVQGRFGQAAVFDGVRDFVATGKNPFPQTNFTLAAWVFPDRNTGFNYVAGTQLSNQQGTFLRVADGGAFGRTLAPSAASIPNPAGSVPVATWTHLAMTVSRTEGLKLYVNGNEVAANAAGTSHTTHTNFTIARCPHRAEMFFAGRIDDVAIWSGVLTPAQLQHAMQRGAENFNFDAAALAPAQDAAPIAEPID